MQRELLRLGIMLERTRPPQRVTSEAITLQLDLAWSQMERLEQGLSRTWIEPYADRVRMVGKLRALLEHLDRLFPQAEEGPEDVRQALASVNDAHLLANQLMVHINHDLSKRTTLLNDALTGFRQRVGQYAVGLVLLITLLAYITWRDMRSERALRESEQRFRTVLENVHLVAVGLDVDGRLTFCNDFLLRLTDWQRHEVLGQDWFATFLPAEHRGDVQRLFAQETLPNHFEHDIVTRHGERRVISCNVMLWRNARGQVIGVNCIGEDITERKRAEEALQKAHDELEMRVHTRTAALEATNASLQRAITERQRLEDELLQVRKLESLGVLAGGIAHDFNNLLTAIMGNVSLAKFDTPPHHPAFVPLHEAEQACGRAAELTRQLLTFSKGGAPIKRIAVVADLLEESVRFALLGSNVRCALSIADDLWPADIDTGQINQAINNILLNAVQAMPDGGTIDVQAKNIAVDSSHMLPLRAGDYVKVSMTDQGMGIATDNVHKIFDPYFTTKPQGTGLGLATTYAIMQKHAGHITVSSAAGVGTTFTLYLPAASRSTASQELKVQEPQRGAGRILVMDDEATIRRLVERLLTSLGYHVTSAHDGQEAIALYAAARTAGQPFDVVIMDLTIPGGMGGKQALQHLLDIDPQIKAIVSSGYSTDPVMANFRNYGFRGVVTKPYSIAELSATLHRVMVAAEATAPQVSSIER